MRRFTHRLATRTSSLLAPALASKRSTRASVPRRSSPIFRGGSGPAAPAKTSMAGHGKDLTPPTAPHADQTDALHPREVLGDAVLQRVCQGRSGQGECRCGQNDQSHSAAHPGSATHREVTSKKHTALALQLEGQHCRHRKAEILKKVVPMQFYIHNGYLWLSDTDAPTFCKSVELRTKAFTEAPLLLCGKSTTGAVKA